MDEFDLEYYFNYLIRLSKTTPFIILVDTIFLRLIIEIIMKKVTIDQY
jgi:hypothetical protein